MFRAKVKMITAALAAVLLLGGVPTEIAVRAMAQDGGDEPPRIGWEESFEDIDRWVKALKKPPWGSPITDVKAVDGAINIVTPLGALGAYNEPGRFIPFFKARNLEAKRKDWPKWPENAVCSFTNFEVRYEDLVDFDTYHYIVIRIVEKATFLYLNINSRATKIAFTTGIHAQDLRTLDLKGKQTVRFSGQFANTSGHVKIDYIRLVRELTPEEEKGLIGEGITVRDENLSGHPYHRLEALNARAGRPRRTERMGGEWCVFRDVATGAAIWRMTASPKNEYKPGFNCDGSAFRVNGRGGGGICVFDWPSRSYKFVKGGFTDNFTHPFSSTEPSVIVMAEGKWLKPRPHLKVRVIISRCDFRAGTKTEMASFETNSWGVVRDMALSPDSSKLTFAFRETPTVFFIDPTIADPAKRCREITLPTRVKGGSLINNDTEIGWYNCYTYQPLVMNLKTGKVTHGNNSTAGGHGAGGPHMRIGPYVGRLKLLVKRGAHPQTEATADDVRIWANYKKPVSTDYGHISRNEKWMVTNGVANAKWMVTNGDAGDVREQHLMFAINDPATVLRACHYNTSRDKWITNTYSRTSPDATKLAYVSDQFDDGDIYFAITGLPAPPTGLTAKRKDGEITLNWKSPEGARENGGYRLYRSASSGSGFVALNREPIQETTFADETALQGAAFYLVAMTEPSDLEGHFSNEAAVGAARRTPRTFFVEAENCAWKPPVREVLHGDAFGSRYLRVYHASPDEPVEGSLKRELPLPAGTYSTWVRGRAEDDSGDWRCEIQGKSVSVRFEKQDTRPPAFIWVKAGTPVKVTGNKPHTLVLTASTDGLAVDKFVLTSDPSFDAKAAKTGPAGPLTEPPLPASALEAFEVTPQALKLRWQASPTVNVARYDIHVGGADDPGSLGNATIIGSTVETAFEDWGLRPGTKYTYRVVAVDSRGNRSEPIRLEVTTAAQAVQVIEADAGEAPQGKAPFSIEVKEAGPFLLWAKYRPAYAKSLKVNVEIDGKSVGAWRLRAPYGFVTGNKLGGTPAKNKKRPPHVFTDKIVADGKDVFKLSEGRHTVTFVLDPKLEADQHAFEHVYASNDHSYRPEGYNPRANFAKR